MGMKNMAVFSFHSSYALPESPIEPLLEGGQAPLASISRSAYPLLVSVDDLTKERLPTPEAVLTLGALAVRALQEHGILTLFINEKGIVELCPPGELEMDGLSEQDAIVALGERGYTDERLVGYLKGREARKR
jgi:hypothetical protein